MATLSKAESRRLYSWWWDSHISPKNSKWLAENLTDMDAKVKLMIKLIESDADSFARRADMYYKQRPELMKLVEESYRAYRALAERYDHATGALRQAHKTMADAFPNQVPFAPSDDSPSGPPGSEGEPRTPEMPHPMAAPFDPDELPKGALGLSPTHVHGIKRNGIYSNKSDSISSIQGLKQLNALLGSGEGEEKHGKSADGSARKSRNFDAEDRKGSVYERKKYDAEDKHNSSRDFIHGKTGLLSENDVASLKQALAKLEAEKEATLLQYKKSLESLSDLESKVYSAHKDAKELNERASKAEDEVQTLKHALMKLDDEKKAGIVNYLQCLERITELETNLSCAQEEARSLNERASNAEDGAQTLKQALARLETENEAALLQYKQCLERISDLETKLSRAEEEAKRLNERGDRAEAEVQSLMQTITALNEGKEDAALQYQHCLEKISDLETKISHAQEEARILNDEITLGLTKLKASEEQHLSLERANQSLQAEVDTLMNKVGVQTQELKEKHEELESLRLSLQEEQLRGMQAEDALISLRNLYSMSQEEQKSLKLELQSWVQMLEDLKLKNQGLEDEVSHLKEENSSLHELNLSSTMSIKNFQDEVVCMKEAIGKLEGEVEFRVDQRNALQQEIYCLKEEINDLSGRHGSVIEQVESAGLKPDCLGLSVRNLQEENSQLKDITKKDKDEKASLLEKLSHMKQLSEKNVLVENSLSDANAELEVLREKLMALEENFNSLQVEKSTLAAEKSVLIAQLGMITANLEKLSEKNTLLEKSLADLNAELEGSKATSKSLEESCQYLNNEKSGLITERDSLVIKLEAIEQRLKEVEKSHVELEDKHSCLEKEKESIIHQVEEVRASLDQEKQVHAIFVQSNETRLFSLEDQMQILQDERKWRNVEFEEEQDRTVTSQFETFVMQRCILDVEEKNLSLFSECQKYFEASTASEKLISKLEQENLEQQLKVKSLMNQVEELRRGIHQMLKSLHSDIACEGQDEKLLQHVVNKIDEMERNLLRAQDEKQELVIERSVLITLLQQLKMEASDLESQRNNLDRDLMIRTKELLLLQSQKDEVLEMNRELRLDIGARDQHVELLKAEMEMEYMKLSDLQESYLVLRDDKSNAIEENKSLMNEFSNLKEEKCILEEENSVILQEVMVLSQLCLIFKSFGAEKSEELKLLSGDVDSLQGVNGGLEKEIVKMREGLEIVEAENVQLKESVEKLENELITFKGVSDQLNDQIETGKELLKQKEMELSYVQGKLKLLEVECSELEQQICILTEDKFHQHIEIVCLQDVNEMFESELAKLHDEINEYKTREEILIFELQETRNEVELCEAEAEALYDEQQLSITHAAMFKEKATQLKGACDNLEVERASQVGEIKQLKQSLRILQSENHGLRSEMAMYLRNIFCLADSITSLEDHVLSAKKIHQQDAQHTKDAHLARPIYGKSSKELSKSPDFVLGDRVLDLQDLQDRVKAMERAVLKMKELKKQDNLDTNRKNVILVKDIPLDQVSDSSPYDPRFDPSRRRSSPKNEDILELWQTTKQDRSISMKVNRIRKLPSKRRDTYIDFEALEPKREVKDEELIVDKLEVSNTVIGEHREGSKRKVLERLASDAQKLANLQITVQDLKMKVEKTSKSERSKHAEYEMVEGQLHEIETAIMQLIALNGKLTEDAEEDSFPSNRKSEIELEETGKGRSRVSEQARRGSEKLGRLLVEVQRIQFVMLKLDGRKESKGITVGDRRRVLLRDYLYGDRRNTRRRKRDRFCACIKPSTKEDW